MHIDGTRIIGVDMTDLPDREVQGRRLSTHSKEFWRQGFVCNGVALLLI